MNPIHTERFGTLTLDIDASEPKAMRLRALAGAHVTPGEKVLGLGAWRGRLMVEPGNALLWRHDKAKDAPRGAWGSWSFALPGRFNPDGLLPFHNDTLALDDDFAPLAKLAEADALGAAGDGDASRQSHERDAFAWLPVNYSGDPAAVLPRATDGLVTSTTGHGSHDKTFGLFGGPLVADHLGANAPHASREVFDIDAGDSTLHPRRHAGLHGPFMVRFDERTRINKGSFEVPLPGIQVARNYTDAPDGDGFGFGVWTNQLASQVRGEPRKTVMGYDSHELSGPFFAGHEFADQHLHDVGKDGNVNATHIHGDAYFSFGDAAGDFDGPLHLRRRVYPKVASAGTPWRVFCDFDKKRKHSFIRRHPDGSITVEQRDGKWDWWVRVPWSPPDDGDPPTYRKPPSKPPTPFKFPTDDTPIPQPVPFQFPTDDTPIPEPIPFVSPTDDTPPQRPEGSGLGLPLGARGLRDALTALDLDAEMYSEREDPVPIGAPGRDPLKGRRPFETPHEVGAPSYFGKAYTITATDHATNVARLGDWPRWHATEHAQPAFERAPYGWHLGTVGSWTQGDWVLTTARGASMNAGTTDALAMFYPAEVDHGFATFSDAETLSRLELAVYAPARSSVTDEAAFGLGTPVQDPRATLVDGALLGLEGASGSRDARLFFRDASGVGRSGRLNIEGFLTVDSDLLVSGSATVGALSSDSLTTGSVTIPALTAGRVLYTGTGGLLSADANLTYDGVSLGLTHTAVADDSDAFRICHLAAGHADSRALDVAYSTGNLAAGEATSALLVSLDESAATGGDVCGLEVLSTAGSATPYTALAGVGVGPIIHQSGAFANPDSILVNAADQLAALSSGGAGGVSVFVADNDTMTIGSASKFEEVEFLLATGSSGAGIKPTFEFSTGVGTWTAFAPTDGTNAMRNSGVIAFIAASIPAWAVGAGSEYLVRITRTRNSLATTPIADTVQIAQPVTYLWGKTGAINALSFAAASLTSGRVPIVSTAGLLIDDAGLAYNAAADALTVAGYLRVGGSTHAVAANDFSAGDATTYAFMDHSGGTIKFAGLDITQIGPSSTTAAEVYRGIGTSELRINGGLNSGARGAFLRLYGGTHATLANQMQVRADEYTIFNQSASENRLRVGSFGFVFNEGGLPALDFRVEGDTVNDAFFLDAGKDLVRLGGSLSYGAKVAATIATAAFTAPAGAVRLSVSPEGGIDDTVSTITATNHEDGSVLVLYNAHATASVTVDEAGNIRVVGTSRVLAAASDDSLTLIYDGTNWIEQAYAAVG